MKKIKEDPRHLPNSDGQISAYTDSWNCWKPKRSLDEKLSAYKIVPCTGGNC